MWSLKSIDIEVEEINLIAGDSKFKSSGLESCTKSWNQVKKWGIGKVKYFIGNWYLKKYQFDRWKRHNNSRSWNGNYYIEIWQRSRRSNNLGP